MQKRHLIVLVALCIGFVTNSFSQKGNIPITNGIGVQGGITQFEIITDNFETQQTSGWIGGMAATVDIPHKWYNVSYNIQFSENSVDILASPTNTAATQEFVDYKIFTAQVALLMHVKIIKSYLTIDLGPMFQYNSDIEIKDKAKENYFITNYDNLLAKDISKISKINFNGAVGLSAGVSHFRVKAQYIYGFTNMLNKLNKNNLDLTGNDKKIKGNQSMLALTAMISF